MVGLQDLMSDMRAISSELPAEEEGLHVADATNAKLSIRSGWGQSITMHDLGSQQAPSQQYMEISNSKKVPLHNFIRMEQEISDKMFMIRAAGFQLNVIENNNMRVVKNGSEFIWIQTGNLVRNTAGAELRYNNLGIYWSRTMHVLQVGESPIHGVVITKSPWHCPLTGMVHWPSFSKSVFVSE